MKYHKKIICSEKLFPMVSVILMINEISRLLKRSLKPKILEILYIVGNNRKNQKNSWKI